MSVTTQSYRRSRRSVRLSFRFRGEEITLFDRRRLEQEALPSTDLQPRAAAEWTGCWIELQDASGNPSYRRPMPHPMLRRSEGPEDDGVRQTVIWAQDRGAFSVAVPDLPGAELVVFASPTDRPEMPQAATEIVRVPVREPRTARPTEREA